MAPWREGTVGLSPSTEAIMSIATRTPDDVRLNDPDADLVDALRRRDERALMTLVRRYSPMVLRVARSYVGSELAEDVVQETWIAGQARGVQRHLGQHTAVCLDRVHRQVQYAADVPLRQ